MVKKDDFGREDERIEANTKENCWLMNNNIVNKDSILYNK